MEEEVGFVLGGHRHSAAWQRVMLRARLTDKFAWYDVCVWIKQGVCTKPVLHDVHSAYICVEMAWWVID